MILEGKVVIVSGIGSGLGQELAINAVQQGAKVVLAARTQAFLEEVEAEVQKTGAETLVVTTDITNTEQCQNLVDKTVERFGLAHPQEYDVGGGSRAPVALSVIRNVLRVEVPRALLSIDRVCLPGHVAQA